MDWITRTLKLHPEQRPASEALGRLRAMPEGEARAHQAAQAFDEVVASCEGDATASADLVRAAAKSLPDAVSGRVWEAGLTALERHAPFMAGNLPGLAVHLYDEALKDLSPGARVAAVGALLDRMEEQGLPGGGMGRTVLDAAPQSRPLLERPVLASAGDPAARVASEAAKVAKEEARPVVQAALSHLEQVETSDLRRAVAGLGRDVLEHTRFRETREALAPEVLTPLAEPHELDGPGLARSLEAWLEKAETGSTVIGRYVDDKGTVARDIMGFLEANAPEEGVRKLASLTRMAVDSVNFSKSVEQVARQGLREMQKGGEVDDARLARVASGLVDQALNTSNALGRFQADKSTLIRGLVPWMQAELKEDSSQRILTLWSQSLVKTTFADTDALAAKVALDALEKGRADDGSLAKLALKLVERGTAGTAAGSSAYANDKARIALQAASALQGLAQEASSRDLLGFYQHAMNGTAFGDTIAKTAAPVFQAVADGAPADPRSLARLGAGLVKGAEDGRSIQGRFHADSSTVAANVADHLERIAPSREDRAAAAMVKAAVGAARYVESGRAAAKAGFGAYADGRCQDRAGLARVATEIFKKAEVGETRQDRGPLAGVVVQSLSHSGLDAEPTALALMALAGMMHNGVDHEVRTAAAERGLKAWAGDSGLRAGRMAEVALAGVKEPRDRREMLTEAVHAVARRNGGEALTRAAAGLRAAGSDEGAMLRVLDEVAALTPTAEEVKKLAEGLARTQEPSEPQAGETPQAAVQDDDEWVTIGSVRLRKASREEGQPPA